jgi:hypothetical protein
MIMATCRDEKSSAAAAWALDRDSGLKPDLDDMENP